MLGGKIAKGIGLGVSMVHLTDAVQVRIRHLPSSWKTLSVPSCVAARIHRLESECSQSESLENEGSVNRHQYTVAWAGL